MTLTEILAQREAAKQRSLKYVEDSYEEDIKRIENTFLFLQEAAATGLVLPIPTSHYGATDPKFDVDMMGPDGRNVRLVCGELENAGIEPACNDLRKRQVIVSLQPKNKNFAHITFRYKRQLDKNDKCKLKRYKSSSVSVECKTGVGE